MIMSKTVDSTCPSIRMHSGHCTECGDFRDDLTLRSEDDRVELICQTCMIYEDAFEAGYEFAMEQMGR